MKYLVFDIETRNTFEQVGSDRPEDLDLSILSIYDSETDKITSYEMEELEKAWPLFKKTDAIVGFNIEHFDIPILNKYYPEDLSVIKTIDLLVSVRDSIGRRIKLDNIAEMTLGENKSGNGLDAIKWWNEGKKDLIKEYCEKDVLITKNLFLYAMENKKLFFLDKNGKKIEASIDISQWKINEPPIATQSLF
jgi:DEAD/DEAH box helicase domain-containing protein